MLALSSSPTQPFVEPGKADLVGLIYRCHAVPQDWDQPETIPDPDAKKPDDWDEDMDGEWEPPMITNPEFKVRLEVGGLLTAAEMYCHS